LSLRYGDDSEENHGLFDELIKSLGGMPSTEERDAIIARDAAIDDLARQNYWRMEHDKVKALCAELRDDTDDPPPTNIEQAAGQLIFLTGLKHVPSVNLFHKTVVELAEINGGYVLRNGDLSTILEALKAVKFGPVEFPEIWEDFENADTILGVCVPGL
jgi:hypothetical protein